MAVFVLEEILHPLMVRLLYTAGRETMRENPGWRREMDAAYREVRRTQSDDMTAFYLSLEQISKKYFDKGLMKEGDSFQFALSTGGHFSMRFYKDSSEVALLDEKFQEIKKLISRENSAKKEYHALDVTSAMLKASKGYIGEQYPIEFYHVLDNMKPGQIISFVDGHTYVCAGREKGSVFLTDIFDGDIENFSFKAIKKREVIAVNHGDPKSVQGFYLKNSKHLTERVEYNYSTKDDALLRIKNLENNLRYGETKSINIAKMSIKATKNPDGSVSWHDSNGKHLQRDDVAMVFGILNNHINNREYIRTTPTRITRGADIMFEKHLEALSAVHNCAQMAKELLEYAKKNGQSLTIRQRFLGDGDKSPSDLVIVGDGDESKAFRVTYTDNDFNKGIETQEEVSENDIAKELENIYLHNHSVLKTRTEEQLTQQVMKMAHRITPVQHKIITETAEKTANKGAVILNRGDVKVTSGDVASYLSGYLHRDEKNVTVEEIKETIKETARTSGNDWGKDLNDDIEL